MKKKKVRSIMQENWYRKGWLDAQETVELARGMRDKSVFMEWASNQSCDHPKDCGSCIPCQARKININRERLE